MPNAIITGASKGLGYALAEQLVGAGWHVIIDARGADALDTAADRLRAVAAVPGSDGAGGDAERVEAIAGDITQPAHRDALIRAAVARGGLDLLVNNAGTLGPSPLPAGADLDRAALRDIVETNVIAPHELTRAALPLLRASHGVVLDVTSDAAVEAYPGWGGYGAAKAATEQLRNVLSAEEADVTVWRVDPGDMRTDMHQLAFPGEDISDRPLPETVAPGIVGLLAARPGSGRYRLADFVAADDAVAADEPVADAAVESGAAGSSAEQPDGIAVVALVGDGTGKVMLGDASPESARPIAMWLTIEVDDFACAEEFYRDVVGLPEIDGWSSDGEVGAVFAVGPAARVEIEQPVTPSPGARLAIEFAGLDALTAAHKRIAAHLGAGAPPVLRHRRGHSGFTIFDPRGTEIYLWSEK